MTTTVLQQAKILLGISLVGLRQRSLRAIMTIVGTAGVVSMLVSLLSIAEGYQRVVRTTAAGDSVLVLMNGATSEIASSIPGDEVSLIRVSPLIARDAEGKAQIAAEPFTTVKLAAQEPGVDLNVSLRGVEATSYALTGVRMLSGRLPESGKREVIVGHLARGRLANVDPGKDIRINSSVWRVVGEFASDSGIAESEIWADAGSLAASADRGETVQLLHLRLADKVRLEQFSRSLSDDPRLHVRAVDQKKYLAEQSDTLTGFMHVVCYGISFLMALGAGFAALGTSYASVSSRIREIGTLKALGFHDRSVFLAVIAEAVLLTCIGGLIGAVASYLIFNGLQTSTVLYSSNNTQVGFAFLVSPWILTQAALLAVAIGLFGSLYPAWKVLGISISQASAERR